MCPRHAGRAAASAHLLPWFPWPFFVGLAVFAAVPTTLSSGVTLVQNGRGNAALALLLVVATNLMGIVTTPLWLQAYDKAGLLALPGRIRGDQTKTNGSGGDDDAGHVHLNVLSMLRQLALTVLVPLIVGKLVREVLIHGGCCYCFRRRGLSLPDTTTSSMPPAAQAPASPQQGQEERRCAFDVYA